MEQTLENKCAEKNVSGIIGTFLISIRQKKRKRKTLYVAGEEVGNEKHRNAQGLVIQNRSFSHVFFFYNLICKNNVHLSHPFFPLKT